MPSKFYLKLTSILISVVTLFCSFALADDKIEVNLVKFTEQVAISVGETPPVFLRPDQIGKKVDISSLFSLGSNPLRVRAFTSISGLQEFELEFWKNGVLLGKVSCDTQRSPCAGKAVVVPEQRAPVADAQDNLIRRDMYFDQTYGITLNDRPPRQTLSIADVGLAEGETGYIYINNAYTGYTLADAHTFSLPQGGYTIGLGVFRETHELVEGFRWLAAPEAITIKKPKYEGRYYEDHVVLSNTAIEVNFSGQVPLPEQHNTRILILPVKYTDGHDLNNQFVDQFTLDESYTQRLYNIMEAVNEAYIKPISYGLNSWSIDVHDTFESAPVRTKGLDIEQPTEFFNHPELAALKADYDVVVLLYHVEMLNYLQMSALDGFVMVQQSFLTTALTESDPGGVPIITAGSSFPRPEREMPNTSAFHEMLHLLEEWKRERYFSWNGVQQLHGFFAHGYDSEVDEEQNIYTDFMTYYVRYMQGRVAETPEMHEQRTPNAPPECVDNCDYVGVFKTVREGLGNLQLPISVGEYHVESSYSTESWLDGDGRIYRGAEGGQNASVWVVEKYPGKTAVYYTLRLKGTPLYLQVNPEDISLVNLAADVGVAPGAQWVIEQGSMRSNTFRIKNRQTGGFLNLSDGANAPRLTSGLDLSVQGSFDSSLWWIRPAEL
ncbi:hypothetical protein TERTU_2045 [Teredinibacter turnerae T7901]|uniref:Ricin B lectin domain-containing protein n=1 Tax=Teredinibacter turnerae (strain ATCC 39867 / T7901) TaxID=377629 RepID=C5BIR5_TERTT|nr:RICIN domain-containing protein [Teredinibacter turnerae]ACR14542.1 hypothetical protein TERTU_2045 [Teredinibacter turnerae T7901]